MWVGRSIDNILSEFEEASDNDLSDEDDDQDNNNSMQKLLNATLEKK